MKKCPNCHVDVRGNWKTCPLCGEELLNEGTHKLELDPYPRVPLQFNRSRAFQLLRWASFFFVCLLFVVELFLPSDRTRIEYIILAMISLWMTVMILIRKRRNIAKGIVYLILFLSLFSLYFDRLNGWTGWSLTYAVPIICSACLFAMWIAVKVVRLSIGDYVLYLQLAALLGFIPLFFLVFNWTTVSWPSWVSFSLSAGMFLSVLVAHWTTIISELKKRMDV